MFLCPAIGFCFRRWRLLVFVLFWWSLLLLTTFTVSFLFVLIWWCTDALTRRVCVPGNKSERGRCWWCCLFLFYGSPADLLTGDVMASVCLLIYAPLRPSSSCNAACALVLISVSERSARWYFHTFGLQIFGNFDSRVKRFCSVVILRNVAVGV